MDCTSLPQCTVPNNGVTCQFEGVVWKSEWYTSSTPNVAGSSWAYVAQCDDVDQANGITMEALAYTLLAVIVVFSFFIGMKMGYSR